MIKKSYFEGLKTALVCTVYPKNIPKRNPLRDFGSVAYAQLSSVNAGRD